MDSHIHHQEPKLSFFQIKWKIVERFMPSGSRSSWWYTPVRTTRTAWIPGFWTAETNNQVPLGWRSVRYLWKNILDRFLLFPMHDHGVSLRHPSSLVKWSGCRELTSGSRRWIASVQKLHWACTMFAGSVSGHPGFSIANKLIRCFDWIKKVWRWISDLDGFHTGTDYWFLAVHISWFVSTRCWGAFMVEACRAWTLMQVCF